MMFTASVGKAERTCDHGCCVAVACRQNVWRFLCQLPQMRTTLNDGDDETSLAVGPIFGSTKCCQAALSSWVAVLSCVQDDRVVLNTAQRIAR